ncbi:hypothetical protein CBR_g29828 [Chara braunii]|uniref:Uncharacterized protein n=1 Tax=Chara braunii TaxID=69332 RepID=A0A388JWQ5_CHABU|nr:hypothetical protein CBR_g29828 [Chara braunii]|eukprot:GBG62220.1 hypothetical protein CBR_g29828 [Chara braunii]
MRGRGTGRTKIGFEIAPARERTWWVGGSVRAGRVAVPKAGRVVEGVLKETDASVVARGQEEEDPQRQGEVEGAVRVVQEATLTTTPGRQGQRHHHQTTGETTTTTTTTTAAAAATATSRTATTTTAPTNNKKKNNKMSFPAATADVNAYTKSVLDMTWSEIAAQTTSILAVCFEIVPFVAKNATYFRTLRRSSRVYRELFKAHFFDGKPKETRKAFLFIIWCSAFVLMKPRVQRIISSLKDDLLKTEVQIILDYHFVNARAQADDVNKYTILDVRSAFPDCTTLFRMRAFGKEMYEFHVYEDIPTVVVPATEKGRQMPSASISSTAGHLIKIPKWFAYPHVGQLNLNEDTQRIHRKFTEHFWRDVLKKKSGGHGHGFDSQELEWYNTTIANDEYALVKIGNVIPPKKPYDLADMIQYADELNSLVSAEADKSEMF